VRAGCGASPFKSPIPVAAVSRLSPASPASPGSTAKPPGRPWARRAPGDGVAVLGPPLRFIERTKVIFEGKTYLFFGGNDYHRLSSHPAVVGAFCEAARIHGLSSAGSRTTTGNHPLYLELEEAIARFVGAEAAAVFASGYLANLVLLQAAAAEFQRFFIDAEAHSSLFDAAAVLPAHAVHRFRHADAEDLAARVRADLAAGERPLVLTDGVFPSRGEMAPIGAYWDVIAPQGGRILVDDAHAVAVVGASGKGSAEEHGLSRASVLQTGTLSKGIGTSGGFVAGSRELVQDVEERSLAFIGSTGMSVPLAAAGVAALDLLARSPSMIAGLRARVLAAKERVRSLGLDIPRSPAAILSVTLGDAGRNRALREALLEAGIYPPFIHYPGGPPGGHFRFTLASAHTDEDVEALLGVIARVAR